MVVLVKDVKDARMNLQRTIVSAVTKIINEMNDQINYEDDDDPFWLRFVFHKPEFLTNATPVMLSEDSDSSGTPNGPGSSNAASPSSTGNRSPDDVEDDSEGQEQIGINGQRQSPSSQDETTNPSNDAFIRPGDQISTEDGTHGTIGLFIHSNIGGFSEHYGVTCFHVAFDQQRCTEPQTSITKNIFLSCLGAPSDRKLNPRGYEAALHTITNHPEPCNIRLQLKDHHVSKFEMNHHHKTTLKPKSIGAFQCGLYGVLEASNSTQESVTCMTCNGRLTSKKDNFSRFIDIALFSVDNSEDCRCDLKIADDSKSSKWRIWNGDFKDLDPCSQVFTYNVRDGPLHSEHAIPDRVTARACTRVASVDYYGVVTTLKDNKVVRHQPHIRLKTNDHTNDRLFADEGDSGSLLFQEVEGGEKLVLGILCSRYHRHQNCPNCNNSVHSKCTAHNECDSGDCSVNFEDCKNPNIAYGFVIQPALDVIATRLFLADAKENVDPEGHVASNNLKISDFAYFYVPCLGTCMAKNRYQLHRRCICEQPIMRNY